jgi:hypothetical protein
MTTKNNVTDQYLAFEVPHSAEGKGAGQSYLRLGNLPGENESPSDHEPGDDDIITRQTVLGESPAWPDKMHKSFITSACADNMRTGGDQEPPAPIDEWRKELGWRDHCHGNRITTTQGDKIEVITGNYKLVVLGGSDGSKSTGLDMSGGHTVNWAQTPGCIKRIWADGDKWVVTWSTENANERRFFDGKSYVHHVGGDDYYSVQYVGGAHPEMPHAAGGPIQLSRSTTFSKQIIGEALGKEIWNVTAGGPALQAPDFSELAMLRAPPREPGSVTSWGYAAADLVHDVKVAKVANETARILEKRVVDTECPDVQQKSVIANYAEEYTGVTRSVKAFTSSRDSDEKVSAGGIHSFYTSFERRDMSLAGNHFNFRAGVMSEDLNLQGALQFSLVAAPVVTNVTAAGALINVTAAAFRYDNTDGPDVDERKGASVEDYEELLRKVKLLIEVVETIVMLI